MRKVIIENHIKEMRMACHMTQENLAKNACLSQNTISDIETGKRGCTLEHAYLISRAFGLDIEEMFDFHFIPKALRR